MTTSTIKLAIVLVDISGATANAAFQVPSPAHQQALYQASLDDTNAHGGVACRKLVGQFYRVNPIDQSSMQGACLTIAQSKPFAVIDVGAYTNNLAIAQCYPQHQIPFFTGTPMPDKLRDQTYPYFFGGYAMDTVYRNTVFALQKRGYFSAGNGFVKLGFFYKDCAPEVNQKILGWLQQAGVPSSKVVTYNGGCPNPFVSPADVQQAIFKFQQAGVTHVLMAQVLADTQTFTNTAQQQGFRPKYAFAGTDIVGTSYGTTKPNYANIANAIAINPDRYAEEHTPGSVPSAGTARCNALLKAHGFPTVYAANDAGISGYACDQIWQFAAALGHAPRLARDALAVGFQGAKSIEFSYPWGPNDLTGSRTTSPGQFWRPVQFMTSCSCWRILDRTFQPSFR